MGVGLGSMASVRLLTNPDRLDMLHRYCIIYFVCFLSCFLDIIIAVVCSWIATPQNLLRSCTHTTSRKWPVLARFFWHCGWIHWGIQYIRYGISLFKLRIFQSGFFFTLGCSQSPGCVGTFVKNTVDPQPWVLLSRLFLSFKDQGSSPKKAFSLSLFFFNT